MIKWWFDFWSRRFVMQRLIVRYFVSELIYAHSFVSYITTLLYDAIIITVLSYFRMFFETEAMALDIFLDNQWSWIGIYMYLN